MGKKIRWLILIAALLVFIGSGSAVLVIGNRYRASRAAYTRAAEEFTQKASPGVSADAAPKGGSPGPQPQEGEPPVYVDFARLRQENPEVVGWLYCEDSIINYPVVQGTDNDFYLHHSYDKVEDTSGAIFVDAACAPGFADSNAVIYGHNMSDGSMFASLENWRDQAYYEQHPVMWLFTPEADYKVLLFSGYTTSAYSDTYRIFQGPGKTFDAYLAECAARSDFSAAVPLDRDGHYVTLSTCAYDFDEARYVLHGKLEKVDTR